MGKQAPKLPTPAPEILAGLSQLKTLPEGQPSFNNPYSTLGTTNNSKYLEGLTYDRNPEYIKAVNQGFFSSIGNGIIQGLGSMTLGAAEGVGYLGVGNVFDKINNTEQEFGNSFSNKLREWNEDLRTKGMPVYTTPDDEGFKPWDYKWWAVNTPSILSAVSLLIPAYGATKLVETLGKGIGSIGKAMGGGKVAKTLGIASEIAESGEPIAMAAFSRHMENMMEGMGTYETLYQQAKEKGLNEDESIRIAAKGATDTYNKNWPLIATDIIQFGLAFKSFKNIGRIKSIEETTKKGINDVLIQAGLEGGEEAYQFIVGEETKRKAAIQGELEKDDYSTYSERMMNYVSNGDFWTAAFFGGLGGAVFQGVGSKIEAHSKAKQQIVDDIQKSALEKSIAVLKDSPEEFTKSTDIDIHKLIITGLENGRVDKVEQMFNEMKNSKPEGTPDEDKNSIDEKANQGLEDLKYLESVYSNIFKDNTRNKTPELIRFELANRAELISNIRLATTKTKQQNEIINEKGKERGLDSSHLSLLKAEIELNIVKNEFKDNSPVEEEIKNKKIKAINSEISLLRDTIKTNFGVTDKDITNTLNINKSTLSSVSLDKVLYELRIEQINKDYDKLISSAGQKEIIKKIEEFSTKKDNEDFTKLIEKVTPITTKEEFLTIKQEAKFIGKEKQFQENFNSIVSNYRKTVSKFNSDTPTISLHERYKENSLLRDHELNDLKDIAGNASNSYIEFSEEAVEDLMGKNSSYTKKVINYFNNIDGVAVVPTIADVNKVTIASNLEGDNIDNSSAVKVDTLNEVLDNNSWNLQAVQFENKKEEGVLVPDITKPATSNLALKVDWEFLNQGKLPEKAILHFEYDVNDEWNKKVKNFAYKTEIIRAEQTLFELAYYIDGNISNINPTNRKVVGGLGINKDTTYLRNKLFSLIKEGKTGNLGVTTKVKKIIGGRLWKSNDFNNPFHVIKEGTSPVFAIGRIHKSGETHQVILDSNGSKLQNKIDNYTEKIAGKVYMLVEAPSGDILPYSIFTHKIKEFSNLHETLLNNFKLLSNNNAEEEKLAILENISNIVDIKDIGYNNNTYYITIGSIFNPTTFEKTFEELSEFLGELIVQIDVSQINKGDYNKKISDAGYLTTNIHPFTHFHSTKVVIEPVTLTDIKTESIESKSNPLPKEIVINPLGTPNRIGTAGTTKVILTPNSKAKQVIEDLQYEPLDINKTKVWWKKNLPQVSLSILDNLIEIHKNGGIQAWGVFKQNAVELYKAAPKGTDHHEAFHAVFNLFLTKEQREEILNEAVTRYKDSNGNILKRSYDENNTNEKYSVVDYQLKSVEILQSPKADEIFRKGDKNNWNIDKILQELQVPKEQQELIKSFNTRNREEILTSLLANYSYTIEINTAKNTRNFTEDKYSDYENQPLKDENTQHYSNLTVPGGTNYTENEIATLDITPSIKGHAQFSTDNGIGWFRSDEISHDPETEFKREKLGLSITTKTRRILEVQSDLFQKSRDKGDLITKQRFVEEGEDAGIPDFTQDKEDNLDSKNQFLQLLNKDNNWVTFFIKSIIQDSANKGYERILFPTGNTASKVEGHTTLEEFKKGKEQRLFDINWALEQENNFKLKLLNTTSEYIGGVHRDDIARQNPIRIEKLEREQEQIKKELERINDPEGFGALAPIFKFYQNTVTNILKKQGYNSKLITDEYGNTWNELTLTEQEREQIRLSTSNNEYYKNLTNDSKLEEFLADDIIRFIQQGEAFEGQLGEKIKNFFKKLYEFIKSIFTNSINIDSLFYRINTGFYKNKPLAQSNYIRYKLAENPYKVQRNIKTINYYFFQALEEYRTQNSLGDLSDIEVIKKINPNPNDAIFSLYSNVYNGMYDIRAELLKNESFDLAKEITDLMQDFINVDEQGNIINKGNYYMLALRDLSKYGIKIKNVSTGVEFNELEDLDFKDFSLEDFELDEEEEVIEGWQTQITETNPKGTLSYNIKKLLRLTVAYKKIENSDNLPYDKRFKEDTDKFGFNRFINFDELYNYIQQNLADILNKEVMMSTLLDLENHRPEIHGIVEKLSKDNKLATQFFTNFVKVYTPFYQVKKRKISSLEGEQRITSTRFDVYNANRKNSFQLLVDDWYTNLLIPTRNIVTDNEGNILKEKAKEYQKEFSTFISELKKKREVTIEDSNKISSILLKFGIDIDGENLQKEFSTKKSTVNNIFEIVKPFDNYNNLLTKLNTLLLSISGGVNPYKGESNESKTAINVAKIIARNELQLHQDTFINVNKKQVYSYTLPTFLHKKLSEFKTEEGRKSYLSNWWYKRNKWLQDLDSDNSLVEQTNIVLLDGLLEENKPEGVRFYDMTDSELDITDINMFHNKGSNSFAYYRMPILSDTPQAPYLHFKKYNKVEVVDALYNLALSEQDRINIAKTTDIKIKNWNTLDEKGNGNNGFKYQFVDIFNETNVDINNEENSKVVIDNWLQNNFNLEKNRLKENGVLNSVGGLGDNITSSAANSKTFLEDYFYNKVLANAMLIQLTSVDLAFYKNGEDFQKRNGQTFKGTKGIDVEASYGKDKPGYTYRTIYLKDELISSKELENFTYKTLIDKGYAEDFAKATSALYSNGINQTDAQAYITIDRYRKIKIGLGEWEDKYEKAYKLVKKGVAWDDSFNLFFSPIKPFYYNHSMVGNITIPTQNKNSEVVLLPNLANKHPILKKMLAYMNNNNVDSIQFNSAVKVGEHGSTKAEDLEKVTIHTLDNSYYGVQQEVPEHHIDTENLLGSQLKKLILGDLPEEARFFNNTMSKKELVDTYQKLLTTNIIESYDELTKEFKDIKNVQKLLLDQVIDLNLGEYFENALEIVKDQEGIEVFNLPLFNPTHAKRFESILNSVIRNGITKQKINGGSFVLMSNYGLSNKLKVVTNEKTGAIEYMESMLPTWTKKYFPRHPNGEVDLEYINKESPELLELFGYRIPTEHKYSMKNIKVVGFTPDIMGGVIILPAEITKISGEDFDIDKLYLMIPNSEIVDGKLQKVKYNFNKIEELNKEQRDNAIIDIIREIWSHPSISDQIIIPGGFDTLKELAKSNKSSSTINPILPNTQMKYFSTNTNGSNLIGIAANHNTNHSVLQYTDIELTIPVKFNGMSATKLNRIKTLKEDGLISRNVSEFLAAFVDNAKEPVANDLNLNEFTFNTGAMIVRLGYDLATVEELINDETIKRYTKLFFKEGGTKIGETKAYKDLIKELEEKEDNYAIEILKKFKLYKELADSLSILTIATKADTNGTGKSMAANHAFLTSYEKVKKDKNLKNTEALLDGSVYPLVNISTDYGIRKPQEEILSKYFPYANTAYTKLYEQFEKQKGKELTEDELNKINNFTIIYVSSGFDFFKASEKEAFINKFPQTYLKLKDKTSIKQFELLRYLKFVPKTDTNTLSRIEFASGATVSNEQREIITRSWEAMLVSDDLEIKKLAQDLVKYSFFTNGLSFTYAGFGHLVPSTYLDTLIDSQGVTYRDYLYKLLKESVDPNMFDPFMDQFNRHEITEYLIPRINLADKNNIIANKIIENERLTSFFISSDKVKELLLINEEGTPNTKYYKIVYNDKYYIYRWGGTNNGDLIYNIVEPLGFGKNIFEFNRYDEKSTVILSNKLPKFSDQAYFIDNTDSPIIQYQLNTENKNKEVNNKLNNVLKQYLNLLGFTVKQVDEILTINGNNAIASVDMVKKVIKIVKEGQDITTLPEEVGHVIEAYNRGSDWYSRLRELAIKTSLYEEVKEKYKNDYSEEEAFIRETIAKLIGEALINKNSERTRSFGESIIRIVKRLWEAFANKFRNANLTKLNLEIDSILNTVTNDVLDLNIENLPKNVKIDEVFYQLTDNGENKAQELLKKGIDATYKKIQIYKGKALSEFVEREQKILDKLTEELDKGLYKKGLLDYAVNAKRELRKIINRYEKINRTPATLDEKRNTIKTLYQINNYVLGFKETLEGIAASDVFSGNTSDMKNVTRFIADTSKLVNKLEQNYYEIGKPILAEILKEFSSNNKLDISASLDILDKDISYTQRWLDALAETSDSILSIIDVMVKDAKQRARFKTLPIIKKLIASQKKLESSGISTSNFAYERDYNGGLTGYLVSKYNIGQFIKERTNFFDNNTKPKEEDFKDKEIYKIELKDWKEKVSKWFDNNTQANPERLKIMKKKKEEFIKNFPNNPKLSLQKYNEWLSKNIIEHNIIDPETGEFYTKFTRELAIPAEKYKNSQYEAIQNNTPMKEYYDTVIEIIEELEKDLPESYKLNGLVPQVRKDFFERLIIVSDEGKSKLKGFKDILKQTKQGLADKFIKHENDTEFGLTDENNKPINLLPIFHTKKMKDPNSLSLDLTSSLTALIYSTNNFSEMNKIIDTLEFAKDVIGERLVKTGKFDPVTMFKNKGEKGKSIVIEGKMSLSYQRYEDFMKMVVYGQNKNDEGSWGSIDKAKLADSINEFTAMSSIALNVYSGVANTLLGSVMVRTEAFVKEFYTTKDLLQADKIYSLNFPKVFREIGQRLDKNKLTLWLEYMNTMQNYDRDFRNIDAGRNTIFSRLMKSSSLYFMNHAGEHFLQSRLTLALANNTKVKDNLGNEMSLWDAFEVIENNLVLKKGLKKVGSKGIGLFKKEEEGKDLTERDIIRFINRQNFINKRLHGIYNDVDKAAVQQYALGRMVSMFRKFIKPGWNKRFAKVNYSEEGEVNTEGYYATLGRFIKNIYKESKETKFSLIKNWNNLEDFEKRNFFRLATEWAYIVAAITAAVALEELAEDDDDNYVYNFAAYEAYRLYSEMRFFSSFTEAWRIIKSPAAAVHQFEKLAKFLKVWEWREEIKRGKYKGFTKFEVGSRELIPFVSTYTNFRTPEEQLRFFTNSGISVF